VVVGFFGGRLFRLCFKLVFGLGFVLFVVGLGCICVWLGLMLLVGVGYVNVEELCISNKANI
jgi:hypothetical protein